MHALCAWALAALLSDVVAVSAAASPEPPGTGATYIAHGRVVPEDPEFSHSPSQLWGLHAIAAPNAWLHGQGSRAIVVAVVDSGIDEAHEDLAENLWRAKRDFRVSVGGRTVECRANDFGFDTIDGDCRPQDRREHGTNVSGIIGARGDNALGTVGVNWKVSLLPVSFLDGTSVGSEARAALALQFVRRVKEAGVADVRVVNLSWGSHEHSAAVEEELLALAKLGIVIVASAGNEGRDTDDAPVYPAGYARVPTMIRVAATRADGALAHSSNHGRHSVDIAAPGIGIRTTDPGNSYDSPFGTSMAAALVSGGVALLASQCPGLTALELKKLILDAADRREAFLPFVAEGRFLNLRTASDACMRRREQLAEDSYRLH
jgi:serine protease